MSITKENVVKQQVIKRIGLKIVLPMKQMMRPEMRKKANMAHLLLLNHCQMALSYPVLQPLELLKVPKIFLPSTENDSFFKLGGTAEESHPMLNLKL